METNKQFISYICSLVPYGLKVQYNGEIYDLYGVANNTKAIIVKPFMSNLESAPFNEIKPYLRPMSSISDDELALMKPLLFPQGTAVYEQTRIAVPMSHFGEWIDYNYMARTINFLQEHHIDYFDFIGHGLALEAPEGMYYVKISTTVEHQESEEPKFLKPDNSVVESTEQHIDTIKQQFGVRKQRTVEEIEKDLEYADEAQRGCIRMINKLETELFEARFGIQKGDRILLASGKTVCYDYYVPLFGGDAMCHLLKKNGEPSVRTIRVKQSGIIKKQ